MKTHKLWEGDDQEMEILEEPKPEPKVAKFEVVKPFTNGKQKVLPGDDVPSDLSEVAKASLLRKGVLRALEE